MRHHNITINAYIFLIVIAAMLRNKTAREVSYPCRATSAYPL